MHFGNLLFTARPARLQWEGPLGVLLGRLGRGGHFYLHIISGGIAYNPETGSGMSSPSSKETDTTSSASPTVECFTDLPSPARKKVRLVRAKVIKAMFPHKFAGKKHQKRRERLKSNQGPGRKVIVEKTSTSTR